MRNNILMTGVLAAMSMTSNMAVAETQYPPNFEQVILYQNPDLVPQKAAAPAEPVVEQKSVAVVSEPAVQAQPAEAPIEQAKAADATDVQVAEKPDDLSMGSYQVGLIALALAALIFWSLRQPEA